MWISRKKWEALEKRIADLEEQVQGQQDNLFIPEDSERKHCPCCGAGQKNDFN